MVAISTRLSRSPELSYHSPLASFLWLLSSCQDLQERRRDHRAPHTPQKHLSTRHISPTLPTRLSTTYCAYYMVYMLTNVTSK